MFRRVLPAAVFVIAGSATAETLTLPGLSPEAAPRLELPTCENIPYSQENCVRVLACIGTSGLYFDGQARGWDQGIVVGQLSSGAPCAGQWKSGGFMGTGQSTLGCEGGLSADVLYYTQDNETGTVIGNGIDDKGRSIRVWSGANVLQFLGKTDEVEASLPCGEAPIPIS